MAVLTTRCVLVWATLSGCGAAPSNAKECILGPWLELPAPNCAAHSLCAASPPPTECSLQGCVVKQLVLYRPDGSYLKAPLTLAAAERQFSRATDGVGGSWRIDGERLVFGAMSAKVECSGSTVLLGEGDFRARTDRPDRALHLAIEAADRSGSWKAVRF